MNICLRVYARLVHFRGLFALPPTIRSLSRFAVKILRELHHYILEAGPHFFLSTAQSRLSLIAIRVYVPHSKQQQCRCTILIVDHLTNTADDVAIIPDYLCRRTGGL